MKKIAIIVTLIFTFSTTMMNHSWASIAPSTEESFAEVEQEDVDSSHIVSTFKSQILETTDIAALLPYVDKNTLLIFDVDYTIFRSKNSLGSPEWARHLIKQEKNKGFNREESFKKIYPIWAKAQKFSEITLIDNRFSKLFQDARKKALSCMAITNRLPDTAEITVWQLNKFGVDFSQSIIANLPYASSFKNQTLFYSGILFAHDFNKRGRVFLDWYNQIIPGFNKRKNVKRIVCVDDSLQNLISMQKAVSHLGLEFVGFYYTAGNAYKKLFKPTLVEIEKNILLKNVSDSELRLELENAGSYVHMYQ